MSNLITIKMLARYKKPKAQRFHKNFRSLNSYQKFKEKEELEFIKLKNMKYIKNK